ncbi:MAG: hypothetical protein ACE5EK_01220, partial [Nitrospinales bacterium]
MASQKHNFMKTMQYSSMERRIAKVLDPFPCLRAGLKRVYQKMNFYFSFDKTPLWLNAQVVLQNIPEDEEHFFGYFDKSCWSADGKNMLYHRLASSQTVEIVAYDLEGKKKKVVGRTSTWNWQQGAMAQWFKRDKELVIYNTVENQNLISVIVDPKDGTLVQKLPMPVQAVSPKGNCII